MVAGWSFQPGTIGRQYSTTPVRCLRPQAVLMRGHGDAAFGDRLDARVGDPGVGEQEGDAQVPQALQFVHVGGE